jgi:hypothetical protein
MRDTTLHCIDVTWCDISQQMHLNINYVMCSMVTHVPADTIHGTCFKYNIHKLDTTAVASISRDPIHALSTHHDILFMHVCSMQRPCKHVPPCTFHNNEGFETPAPLRGKGSLFQDLCKVSRFQDLVSVCQGSRTVVKVSRFQDLCVCQC